MRKRHIVHPVDLTGATHLVRLVCRTAGAPTVLDEARRALCEAGVIEAVQRHDNDALFGWLMEWLSFQGIADAVAEGYMQQHGRVTAGAVRKGLTALPKCSKLTSYWDFESCGFRKSVFHCSRPDFLSACSLPTHDLRNGRLNQTAYSLFLFLRDVAKGDLVKWLDTQLTEADRPRGRDRGALLAHAVIAPMANIYGVSHKVLAMTLSWLLLVGDPRKERWRTAGASMIAVDTLVHAWLHRSGILRGLTAQHLYGAGCYAAGGCADIMARVAKRIDAREFNSAFPRYFPRFVQHAIWRFCSQSGLNECNGVRIRTKRCRRIDCELYRDCGRVALNPQT